MKLEGNLTLYDALTKLVPGFVIACVYYCFLEENFGDNNMIFTGLFLF